MAVTVAQLKSEFPEFTNAPDPLVDRAIRTAKLRVSSSFFGARYDDAVLYLACHLVAINPLAELALLVPQGKGEVPTTQYEQQFEALKKSLGIGIRVI